MVPALALDLAGNGSATTSLGSAHASNDSVDSRLNALLCLGLPFTFSSLEFDLRGILAAIAFRPGSVTDTGLSSSWYAYANIVESNSDGNSGYLLNQVWG